MQQSDKEYGKKELLGRELTEVDLANVYGGKGGSGTSTPSTGGSLPSGFTLPPGFTLPAGFSGASNPSGAAYPSNTADPSNLGATGAPPIAGNQPPYTGGTSLGLGALLASLGL